MLMKVGNEQRKQTIITQNLGRPYIFMMFDDRKEPTVIASDSITEGMARKASQRMVQFDEKIQYRNGRR